MSEYSSIKLDKGVAEPNARHNQLLYQTRRIRSKSVTYDPGSSTSPVYWMSTHTHKDTVRDTSNLIFHFSACDGASSGAFSLAGGRGALTRGIVVVYIVASISAVGDLSATANALNSDVVPDTFFDCDSN